MILTQRMSRRVSWLPKTDNPLWAEQLLLTSWGLNSTQQFNTLCGVITMFLGTDHDFRIVSFLEAGSSCSTIGAAEGT